MKLEKKHYYWIGGIIIALILIYYFWDSISSTLGIGSTSRQFRGGGVAGVGAGASIGGGNPAGGFVGEGSASINTGRAPMSQNQFVVNPINTTGRVGCIDASGNVIHRFGTCNQQDGNPCANVGNGICIDY